MEGSEAKGLWLTLTNKVAGRTATQGDTMTGHFLHGKNAERIVNSPCGEKLLKGLPSVGRQKT
jgi:hypothetical protein